MRINYDPAQVRPTFWTPTEQYRQFIGQPFVFDGPALVENHGTEDETELYPILLSGGARVHAFGEEVFMHTDCSHCTAPEHLERRAAP